MLKKLLKYDFQSVLKYFIPMSIAMLVYSILASLTFQIDQPDLSKGETLLGVVAAFAIAGYVFIFIAYSIITQGLIVVNFFKSMATDTGYLTHTLPVKKSKLILSKVIMGEVVLVVNYLVLLLSLLIFLDVPTNFSAYQKELSFLLDIVTMQIGSGMVTFMIVSIIIIMLLAPLMSISLFYVAIAFGHLMNRHKAIGSIVAYLILMFIIQIIGTIFSLSLGNVQIQTVSDLSNTFLPIIMFAFMAFEIVISAVGFFLTNLIFSKKLNLD